MSRLTPVITGALPPYLLTTSRRMTLAMGMPTKQAHYTETAGSAHRRGKQERKRAGQPPAPEILAVTVALTDDVFQVVAEHPALADEQIAKLDRLGHAVVAPGVIR